MVKIRLKFDIGGDSNKRTTGNNRHGNQFAFSIVTNSIKPIARGQEGKHGGKDNFLDNLNDFLFEIVQF